MILGYKPEVFLVSARLAQKARQTQDPSEITRLNAESGIVGLENYINQNDKFKQNGAIYTGLTKNKGGLGVDAPIKSGVSAPRKR